MLQITVTLHLTGLLLLAPDSAVGTDKGTLPMHVLFPTEGVHVPLHVAQFGWKSDKEHCKEPFTWDPMDGIHICWASLEGWSVELGQRQRGALSDADLPDGTLLLGGGTGTRGRDHAVDRRLFTSAPGRALRARVTLNSGKVTGECAFGFWKTKDPKTGNMVETKLTSVVNWSFQSDAASMDSLTRTALLDSASQTPRASKLDLPPAADDTLHLYVRYMPLDELLRGPVDAEEDMSASHLHAFYDFLDYKDGEPREIPRFVKKGSSCTLPRTPGSPTCLIGRALP